MNKKTKARFIPVVDMPVDSRIIKHTIRCDVCGFRFETPDWDVILDIARTEFFYDIHTEQVVCLSCKGKAEKKKNKTPKLKKISIDGETYFYSFSYDVSDDIADGTWWLQVYSEAKELLHDVPFGSAMSNIRDIAKIRETIQNLVLPKGSLTKGSL